MNKTKPYIAVAPMMDWTDRHCRYFHRLIAPHVHLYTEMVTTGAILHGDRDRFLRFDEAEQPVALQLGGSDPEDLAKCAKIGEAYGYDEINLNCGCPSDRVQNGNFGACLMAEPKLVANCVAAMADAVSIPVTVKCRIGIDNCEDFSFLNKFIEEVSKAGSQKFIIHARKAWLNGLSPKENREIPPIRYDIVQQIKETHPHLEIIVNGQIKTVEDIKLHLSSQPLSLSSLRKQGPYDDNQPDPGFRRDDGLCLDGVMIGREAYQNPWFLAEIEREFFGNRAVLPREMVARAMIPYIAEQAKKYDTPAKSVTRHMLGLYNGLPGARAWRRILSETADIEAALAQLPGHILQAA